MRMRKFFSLMATVLMAVGVQAQTAETALFSETGTYSNGYTLSTANAKLVLGNDHSTKNYSVKLSTAKAYCADLFGQNVMVMNDETGQPEVKTRVVSVVGTNNPKDAELGSTGGSSSYNPDQGNLPKQGTYYMFTPSKNGHVLCWVYINAGKTTYVAKLSDGAPLPTADLKFLADGDTPTEVAIGADNTFSEKFIGTLEFDVEAGETYYIFCNGSKMQFGGYKFTPEAEAPSVPAPVFDPAADQSVEYGSTVNISYEDGLLLYYTTDGSDPESPLSDVKSAFTNPEQVTVDQEGSFTIKAFVEDPTNEQRSQVVTATYTVIGGPVVVGAPTFNPEPGPVPAGTWVTILPGENGQSVTFTSDGKDPAVYGDVAPKGRVLINEETTIRAYSQDADGHKSEEVRAVYTIAAPVIVPEVTFDPVAGTEVEVGDEIAINFDGDNFQAYVTTDGSDPATSMTMMNLFPGETVTVAGEGEFTVKVVLENNQTNEQTPFEAVYPIKKAVVAEVTFDPVAGTEVEVGDEIAINFDGDNFQAYVTTDGSDPATSLTMMNLFPGETVTVAGEGEFTVKVVLENNQTNEQTPFEAVYPIKKAVVAEVTFDPVAGTEVEVGDEIAINFDGDNFQAYVTTDGSDPATSLTMMNLFPGETVTVAGEGEFTVKVVLENNQTNEQTPFEAVYPIKPVAEPWVTFDPVAGTEVAVDDEITIDFDGDNFQAWVTTDGSDPAVSATAANWFPGEAVVVTGEGEFTVKVVLERNGSTSTQEPVYAFEAVYPIKVADVVIETKANGLGTFCYDKDLDFSASDVHAYVARVSGNNVFLTEVTEVPAFTGVLVKGENGAEEVTVPVMEGAAPIAVANDFVGTIEETEVEAGTCSVLSLLDGEEGFYKFLGTVIPANKAYFTTVANNANAKLTLIFDDVDGIKALISDAIVEGKAYNLNGQRVYDSYKGIVIINGKKYVKK